MDTAGVAAYSMERIAQPAVRMDARNVLNNLELAL